MRPRPLLATLATTLTATTCLTTALTSADPLADPPAGTSAGFATGPLTGPAAAPPLAGPATDSPAGPALWSPAGPASRPTAEFTATGSATGPVVGSATAFLAGSAAGSTAAGFTAGFASRPTAVSPAGSAAEFTATGPAARFAAGSATVSPTGSAAGFTAADFTAGPASRPTAGFAATGPTTGPVVGSATAFLAGSAAGLTAAGFTAGPASRATVVSPAGSASASVAGAVARLTAGFTATGPATASPAGSTAVGPATASPAGSTAVGPAARFAAGSAVPGSRACSPAVRLTGFSDALDKTTYAGTFVGNLSALAPDRHGTLAALSDRSALFRLDARTLQPVGVLPLADESGAALDAEGLVADGGTYLVSSETEPSVRRYSGDGRILDRLPVPDALRTAPAGRAQRNGTFEGLTLLPGGRTLVASMEYALAGDSPGLVRVQTWQRTPGGTFRPAAQYAYPADPGLGVPEITATPDGRLLVLERGFTAGVGNTVRLYLADPRHATDTSRVAYLTGQDGVRTVRKTLLADLAACPTLGATAKQPQPNPLLDNIEGMAVTGRTKGRLDVVLVSDDNQGDTQTTRFYGLRVRL